MENILKKFKKIWDPVDNIMSEQEENYEEEIYENDNNFNEKFSSKDNATDQFNSSNVINFKKNMHISCFKPEDYGSRTVLIADELMTGSIVIIDLSGTTEDISRRIIDFLRAIIHAKEGKFMKVAKSTYVLAPKNTDITGTDLISELENNDIYV